MNYEEFLVPVEIAKELKEIGFKYIFTYERRKKIPLKI